MTLAAITVHQPWADEILDGAKTVENRTWYTLHRGPLLIHSGRRGEAGRPRGALGLVTVTDVHLWSDYCACGPDETGGANLHNYAMGPTSRLLHLVLRDPYRFAEPIEANGRMGLWYPYPDLVRDVRKASMDWQGWVNDGG